MVKHLYQEEQVQQEQLTTTIMWAVAIMHILMECMGVGATEASTHSTASITHFGVAIGMVIHGTTLGHGEDNATIHGGFQPLGYARTCQATNL